MDPRLIEVVYEAIVAAWNEPGQARYLAEPVAQAVWDWLAAGDAEPSAHLEAP